METQAIELIKENLKVILALLLLICIFILLSLFFNKPIMNPGVNQLNNFLSQLFLGLSGSLIGTLFVFLAIDLTLRRRKREEVEPKKRAGYRRISEIFSNLNSLIISMAQEGADEDWEPPSSYKDIYIEEVGDKMTNVDLTKSAPAPELDLSWGEYFVMELDRLANRIDRVVFKYGDCLPDDINAALDYDLGYKSLSNLKDWAIMIVHANKEGKSDPNLKSPFVQKALERINGVATKIERNMQEEENIVRMNNCISRGDDLRPWAQDKFSINY